MKKLLTLAIAFLSLFIVGQVFAADLQWDYPTDWANITGWTIYFTDGTNNYNKTIGKADVTQDGVAVTYPAFEDKLNIQYNTQYSIYLTAYNDSGESGPSNTVTYTRSGYSPPVDVLPPSLPGPSGSPGGVRIN